MLNIKVVFTFSFMIICRYQKNVVILHCFSNLYCVKLLFMKDQTTIKLVYKLTNKGYVRTFGNVTKLILQDFPCLSPLMLPKVRSIVFLTDHFGLTHYAKAWKDKYENIIVRVYNCPTQLNIDYV